MFFLYHNANLKTYLCRFCTFWLKLLTALSLREIMCNVLGSQADTAARCTIVLSPCYIMVSRNATSTDAGGLAVIIQKWRAISVFYVMFYIEMVRAMRESSCVVKPSIKSIRSRLKLCQTESDIT